ncbi:WxL domain-containing protein [Lactiplantibacillus modestisalitolerans]|uniref:WxL domain-containing protein n=1 Tax=Lactiplantibacillus modestisalitolerans TaxID=1457219 RepID=A0ABV5WTE5_9LACO|nr:WxL domain-containing protein [Lactiplantibacillus modestisalitolerans]
MQKVKIFSGLASSATLLTLALFPLGALAAGPGTASDNLTTITGGYAADETSNGQAQSNAQFEVTPGALTLNAVPNILLNNTGVENIASQDTSLTAATGNTSGGSGYDGNGTGSLSVSDYRGNHAGWSLTVGLGNFTAADSSTVTSAVLNLNATKGTVDNTATSNPTSVKLSQSTVAPGAWVTSPQTIWDASAASGEGQNTATTTGSSLDVSKQPTISSGTYTATLYWALQNAPAATPAS